MKGTLISFDFVKDGNGDLKFLEMNTDTTISAPDLENHISWDSFIQLLSDSNNTSLEVIYKPEIHQGLVNSLSASVVANAPFINQFNHYKEDLHSNFPTAVNDAPEKFVLRLAYDDNAIIDSYYCKEADKGLRLLTEYNSSSLGVSYYYSGSDAEIDLLSTNSNLENFPDVAVKKKQGVLNNLEFVKVLDAAGWDEVKSTYKGDYIITNYNVSPETLSDGVVQSYRHLTIAYGGGLESIHLGTFIQYAQFSTPETLVTEGSTKYQLPARHYWEYSTSTPKLKSRIDGVFTTDKFVSGSDEPVEMSAIATGTELKSFYIPSIPDTDDINKYSLWSHQGKTLPEGSVATSSIATSTVQEFEDQQGLVFEMLPEGASTPVYLGLNANIITYNTGSDSYGFKNIQTINHEKDFLFNINGELVPIIENNLVVLNQPTGSFFTVDIEPFDLLIVDTDAPIDIIAVHNNAKIKFEPPK
jgi:hypothetical protein